MNTNRIIDDDMLSAFLDGELPAQDLVAVRTALANDSALAERLAALQRVNELVMRHARALDAAPLPSRVLELLNTEAAQPTATILQGPWQRWSRHAGAQLAVAASLVLVLGVAVNYLRSPAQAELPVLATYTEQLDHTPSGATVGIENATLVQRFSFRDRDDRYCRQYQLSTASAGTENVACRTEQGWTLIASLAVPVISAGDYQAASSSAELNAVLDSLMQGAALDLATEASLIERGWQQE